MGKDRLRVAGYESEVWTPAARSVLCLLVFALANNKLEDAFSLFAVVVLGVDETHLMQEADRRIGIAFSEKSVSSGEPPSEQNASHGKLMW